MLGFDGHVKVIDFGIALVKNRQAPVTEFGTVKGKPPYMSPEQVKNEAMDRRSDVFSLGVVLHELLTGGPLFDGDSIYAIALAVEHQEIQPPSRVLRRAAAARPRRGGDERARSRSRAPHADRGGVRRGARAGDPRPPATRRSRRGPSARSPRRATAHRALARRAWSRAATPPRPIGRATGAVTRSRRSRPPCSRRSHRRRSPRPRCGRSASRRRSRARRRTCRPSDEAARGRRGGGCCRSCSRCWCSPASSAGCCCCCGTTARPRAPDAAVALADAAADAPRIVVAPAPDAAPDAAAPADAAVRIDAPPRRPRLDAGAIAAGPPPDAAPPPVPVPVPPAGTGLLSIVARDESYLNVLLDGKPFQVTPQLRKPVAAGPHTDRAARSEDQRRRLPGHDHGRARQARPHPPGRSIGTFPSFQSPLPPAKPAPRGAAGSPAPPRRGTSAYRRARIARSRRRLTAWQAGCSCLPSSKGDSTMRFQLPLALFLAVPAVACTTDSSGPTEDDLDERHHGHRAGERRLRHGRRGTRVRRRRALRGRRHRGRRRGVRPAGHRPGDRRARGATRPPLARNVIVMWGRMPADPPRAPRATGAASSACRAAGWSSAGAIAFEEATDRILPRTRRDAIAFQSVTRPHADGLALTVLDPTPSERQPARR